MNTQSNGTSTGKVAFCWDGRNAVREIDNAPVNAGSHAAQLAKDLGIGTGHGLAVPIDAVSRRRA